MLCSSVEFAPRGAREWLAALFLRSVVRIAVKPVLSPRVAIPWQRWWLKRLTLLIRPRRRVDIQDHVLAGVKGEWVHSARPANAAQSAAIFSICMAAAIASDRRQCIGPSPHALPAPPGCRSLSRTIVSRRASVPGGG